MPSLSRPRSDVPWRSPTVRVVIASTALAPLGVPLISPTLPAFRDAFVLTDAEASLLVSAYFVTGIVLSPFIGLLADRLGRRRVLVPSLFTFSLAGGAIALAPPFWLVLAIRLVQGTAAAGIFITTVTIVGDAFEGVQRNAVLGANTAVLSAGAAVYPLVGGLLVGISWNAPFAAYLVGLPVAAYVYRSLEERVRERSERRLAYLRRVVSLLSPREGAVLYGSAFAVEFLLFGAVFTTLPFLLTGTYGVSPVLVGLTVTVAEVSSVVAASLAGRLARRISDFGLLVAGFTSGGVGLVGSWAAQSPPVIAVAMAILGAGWGLTLPAVDAAVSTVVPAEFRAGALSLRNSATFLGRAAGPVAFAAFAVANGYRVPLFYAGVGAFVFAALLALASGGGFARG